MASLGDRVDRSMFGTQEADAMFRGSEIHKLGPKKYKIVDGAFTHLRAADAALGSRVGLGHAQPRRLRAAQELGLPGQGRAADVPADLLLPDSGGRPGHRLPDPHLRHLDAPGQFAQQRLLLGDLAQPGRDARPRLVLEGRPADGRRIPLRRQRRVAGQRARLVARREGDRRHDGRDDGRDGAAIR